MANAFSRSSSPTFPGDRSTAAIPDPTTTTINMAQPTNSPARARHATPCTSRSKKVPAVENGAFVRASFESSPSSIVMVEVPRPRWMALLEGEWCRAPVQRTRSRTFLIVASRATRRAETNR